MLFFKDIHLPGQFFYFTNKLNAPRPVRHTNHPLTVVGIQLGSSILTYNSLPNS